MIFNNILRLTHAGQIAAMILFGAGALAGIGATGLAFAGVLPWPEVALGYGGAVVPWAGMALQIGVTALFALLAVFLPSARRVLRLEGAHRRFEIDMDDITKAYRAAHFADRAEMFGMRREFDAIRERYQFLKTHPDMAEIDAELLTIAAQMSEQTRELAEVYSDAKVARARESLKQRRVDAEALQERIQEAHADMRDLKRMMEDVDIEESTVASQLQQLREAVTEMGGFDAKFTATRKGAPHLRTVPAE
ncbi:MAG: DNA repair protein [Silicimonas sp.]|nr:DNA repair protein [Silicimonas sp.]